MRKCHEETAAQAYPVILVQKDSSSQRKRTCSLHGFASSCHDVQVLGKGSVIHQYE
jgi:hypothetical protein